MYDAIDYCGGLSFWYIMNVILKDTGAANRLMSELFVHTNFIGHVEIDIWTIYAYEFSAISRQV